MDGFGLPGQDEIGPDFRQWMENEAAQWQTWMRQLNVWLIEPLSAMIKQVEIDRARAIAGMLWRPPESGLDFLQLLQQLPGSTGIADLNHSVEKPLRARFAFDWLGFVNARGKKTPQRCPA